MIPNIVRGSDPAGLVRYLFGKGRRNEHTDQHLVCASGDMFPRLTWMASRRRRMRR